MTGRRLQDVVRRASPLWKQPPTLSSPVNINVAALVAAGTTRVSGTSTTDAVVVWPAETIVAPPTDPLAEAMLTINGFRNVVSIGGHIHAPAVFSTGLAAPATTTDTTVFLRDTSGLPAVGGLNVGGRQLKYTGKAADRVTGVTWNSFSYGNAIGLPMPAGTEVWVQESSRGALAFQDTAGVAHVEGLLADGDLIDGVRYSTTRTAGPGLQLMNYRFDAGQHHDGVNTFDGHPDALQYAGCKGPIIVDRATMKTSGRAIINKTDLDVTPGDFAPTSIIGRDINAEAHFPGGGVLFDNAYALATPFDFRNVWGQAFTRSLVAASNVNDTSNMVGQVQVGRPPGGDFVKAADVGLGYVNTVGYAS